MTLSAFGANTCQKKQNMVAILNFKMAVEDTLEINVTNSGYVLKGSRKIKTLVPQNSKFCTGLHNTMY